MGAAVELPDTHKVFGEALSRHQDKPLLPREAEELIAAADLPEEEKNKLRTRVALTIEVAEDADEEFLHADTPEGEQARAARERLRMLKADPGAAVFASVTPERVCNPKRAKDQLRELRDVLKAVGIRESLPRFEQLALHLAQKLPTFFAPLIMKGAHAQIRKALRDFVYLAESDRPEDIDAAVEALYQETQRTGVGNEINWVVEGAISSEEVQRTMQRMARIIQHHHSTPRLAAKPTALSALAWNPQATDRIRRDVTGNLIDLFKEVRAAGNKTIITVDSEKHGLGDAVLYAYLDAIDAVPEIDSQIALQSYKGGSEKGFDEVIRVGRARKKMKAKTGKPGFRGVPGANRLGESFSESAEGKQLTSLLEGKHVTDAMQLDFARRALEAVEEGAIRFTFGSMNLLKVMTFMQLAHERGIFNSPNAKYIDIGMLKGMLSDEVLQHLTKTYGVQTHFYRPVIPISPMKLFKMLLAYQGRRFDEIIEKGVDSENYVGVTALHGVGSSEWIQTQVGGMVKAAELAYKLQTGQVRPVELQPLANRGKFEPQLKYPHSEAEFERVPVANTDEDYVRRWMKGVLTTGAERTTEYAGSIPAVLGVPNLPHRDRKTDERYGPTHGEKVLLHIDTLATKEDVDLAFETARLDPGNWRLKAVRDRLKVIFDANQMQPFERESFLHTLGVEAGKPIGPADAEVVEGQEFGLLTIAHMEEIMSCDYIELEVGQTDDDVETIIGPWNFGLAIPEWDIDVALALGKRVIFKPAPEAREIAVKLREKYINAGLPESAFILLSCDDEVAAHVSAKARNLSFTGGADTAKKITETNPRLMAHGRMECGAVNPAIITPFDDMRRVAVALLFDGVPYGGQVCAVARDAIVTEGVNMAELKEAMRGVGAGMNRSNASNINVDLVPPIHPIEEGSPLYKGCFELQEGESWLIEPKYPGDLAVKLVDMSICRPEKWTEVFGPVVRLRVMKKGGIKEAMALAKRGPGALTVGVFNWNDEDRAYVRKHSPGANTIICDKIPGAQAGDRFGGGSGMTSRGIPCGSTGSAESIRTRGKFKLKEGRHAPYEEVSVEEDKSGVAQMLETLATNLTTGGCDMALADQLRACIHMGRSYLHEYKRYYSQARPVPTQIVGKYRWVESAPLGTVLLRLHSHDQLRDIFGKIWAATIAENLLVVSVPSEMREPLESLFKGLGISLSDLRGVSLQYENDDEFAGRLKQKTQFETTLTERLERLGFEEEELCQWLEAIDYYDDPAIIAGLDVIRYCSDSGVVNQALQDFTHCESKEALIKKVKRLGRSRRKYVPEKPSIDLVSFTHEEHISPELWQLAHASSVSIDDRNVVGAGLFDLDMQMRIRTFLVNSQVAGDPGLERLSNRKRPYDTSKHWSKRAVPPAHPSPSA